MIDAEAIDVAVLDVNINGQLSYPIADALAARGVPFVFSTGYDKDRIARRLQNLSGVAEAISSVGIERHTRETVDAKGAERRTNNSDRCRNAALKAASTCCCGKS